MSGQGEMPTTQSSAPRTTDGEGLLGRVAPFAVASLVVGIIAAVAISAIGSAPSDATWDRTETVASLIARADVALYRAKDAGRDHTISSEIAGDVEAEHVDAEPRP